MPVIFISQAIWSGSTARERAGNAALRPLWKSRDRAFVVYIYRRESGLVHTSILELQQLSAAVLQVLVGWTCS